MAAVTACAVDPVAVPDAGETYPDARVDAGLAPDAAGHADALPGDALADAEPADVSDATADAAEPDAGQDASIDADVADVAVADATLPDAAPSDAAPSDAVVLDATAPDAVAADAASLDATTPPDAGFAPDAQALDSGLAWACNTCHGDSTSSAPPRAVSGATANTNRGVGAHRSHLTSRSSWHRDVVCDDCHIVPADVLSPGHIDDGLPAELTFGAVATTASSAPYFDGLRCSGVYCHGSTIGGGTNTSPAWTVVDGTEASCGSCHGLPPPAPHPQSTQCGRCHTDMDPQRVAFIHPEEHIDGRIEINGSACTGCHGSTNAAPPSDTTGHTSTTDRGVGAHQSHLAPSTWHRAVACNECHVVPQRLTDPGHADSALPAELTFGPLATADGASPLWDGARCSNTYCHGATLYSGGSNTQPAWTTVDGTQAACGTCHGLPPAAPHSQSTQCDGCHGAVVGPGHHIVNANLHIDGVVEAGHSPDWMDPTSPGFHAASATQGLEVCRNCHGANLDGVGGATTVACANCHGATWKTNCTMCHGGTNDQTGAPPRATWGHAGDPARIGAHAIHVQGGSKSAPFACDVCHITPQDALSPGHIDGATATVPFGSLAASTGAVPVWDRATGTCASVYCHGGYVGTFEFFFFESIESVTYQGLNATPSWAGGGPLGCDACHQLPPPGPWHTQPPHTTDSRGCAMCHPDVNVAGTAITNRSLHVNGTLDVSPIFDSSCYGCH